MMSIVVFIFSLVYVVSAVNILVPYYADKGLGPEGYRFIMVLFWPILIPVTYLCRCMFGPSREDKEFLLWLSEG